MGSPNRLFPNISSLFYTISKYTCIWNICRCLTKTSRWPWTPISLWSGGTPEWSSPTIWTGLVLRIPKLEQEKRNMKFKYKLSGKLHSGWHQQCELVFPNTQTQTLNFAIWECLFRVSLCQKIWPNRFFVRFPHKCNYNVKLEMGVRMSFLGL